MKAVFLASAALLIGASAASAQYAPWTDALPYPKRLHHSCQDKAQRLHQIEARVRDGRASQAEREERAALEHDLNRSCGGYRHRS